MSGRRARGAKLLAALLAVAGISLSVAAAGYATVICDAFGCVMYGPSSPGRPHNSRGMHATVTPSHGAGDAYFHGSASGFRPGEFVAVFKYLPNGRVAFMPSGGKASRAGRYGASVKNFQGIDISGLYHICFKGLRSGRVACGAFRYKAVAWGRRPFDGPGTVTPFNGPAGSGSGSSTGSGTSTSGSGSSTSGSGSSTSGSGTSGSGTSGSGTSGSGTSGSGTSGSGTTGSTCNAWDVSGSWQWVADGFGLGPGNGPATLTQSGTSVTGTINDGSSSGSWTLSGSTSGSTLTLRMNPPPGYAGPYDFTGTVSSTKITGHSLGDFTSGTARCVG